MLIGQRHLKTNGHKLRLSKQVGLPRGVFRNSLTLSLGWQIFPHKKNEKRNFSHFSNNILAKTTKPTPNLSPQTIIIMATATYTNYQITSPRSQYTNDDLLDIYSTTPFGGASSCTSRPSMMTTPQNNMLPSPSSNQKACYFEFPSELTACSSESSYSDALVPYYEPSQEQQAMTICRTPKSSAVSPPNSLQSNALSSVDSYNSQISVPESQNILGTDSVHPKKKTMKKQRKRRTAGGAVGGAVMGGLVLGPVGFVLGGAAGGVATNKLCKARDRRRQRKHEQDNFQQAANRSAVHSAAFA
jgi:hypothetical protein